MTIAWSVECFRLGRRWSGEADTVAGAQTAVLRRLAALGGGVVARKATITRTSALGTVTMWNARPRGRSYRFEEVEAA